jgi:intracellular multiplication protein IcmC
MSNTISGSAGGISGSINLTQAYENLIVTSNSLELLIIATAYTMGFFMMFRGIAMYRAFGQHITQMSRNGELAGPVVYIFVGAMLIYLPSIIDVALQTSFAQGTDELTALKASAFNQTNNGVDWGKVAILVNRYAQIIGLVAFVRGLYLVSKSGDPGVQPGTITRGIVHFVAGVLLINIGATYEILAYTFGFNLD